MTTPTNVWLRDPTVPSGGAGPHTINSAGIPSEEAFGAPAVQAVVASTGIASAEAFGAPQIGAGIFGAGIASAEAFGSPAVWAQINSTGIASAEAFGLPTIGDDTPGAVDDWLVRARRHTRR